MGTREDLIAAKALIDTPEKIGDYRTVVDALCALVPDDTVADYARYVAMAGALRSAGDGSLIALFRQPHADIMALFDRAIAAQAQP